MPKKMISMKLAPELLAEIEAFASRRAMTRTAYFEWALERVLVAERASGKIPGGPRLGITRRSDDGQVEPNMKGGLR